MCPFLDDEELNYTNQNEESQKNFPGGRAAVFFKNDRKYLLIGGSVVFVVLLTVIGLMSSNTPVNIDELPVISAEQIDFKERPLENKQIQHQDKIVYDNISGDKRPVVEKLAPQPENIVNIPELDVSETLSPEEKQNIIQAFDELAPEAEYKINYQKQSQKSSQNNYYSSVGLSEKESNSLQILKNKKKLTEKERTELSKLERKISSSYQAVSSNDPNTLPPINSVKGYKKKKRLKDIVSSESFKLSSSSINQGIMVQVASVTTKPAAEREYHRLKMKNPILKGIDKKIVKVNLGINKGIRYRIQVGPFKSEKEAKRIIDALKANGSLAYISK